MVGGYCSAVEHTPDWPTEVAKQVGRRVAYFRQRTADERGRPLTAQGLANRCKGFGLELGRPTIAKLESGLRQSVSLAEVMVLARALNVAPVLLLFPLGQEDTAEVSPGKSLPTWDAIMWFAGEAQLVAKDGELAARAAIGSPGDLGLFRTHQRLVAHISERLQATAAGQPGPYYAHLLPPDASASAPSDPAEREIMDLIGALLQTRAFIRDRGLTPPRLPADLSHIDPQPVIAGIITSDQGVLVTQRRDRTPPWGFVTGWGEPGESPEDTIIREVKEEADLRIQVGEYLGERDHPATGRHMIYYAARPTHGTEIHLGDKGELLDVRWVSLAEADELMPDMFGPVHEHLARELAEG
jgi:8-oxo-dGTP pyrophosphatase MutT (NUDIX family)